MSSLVSVIVPTYNRPELLARALESIAAQTYPNVEAVVVNDGGENVRDIVAGFDFVRNRWHFVNAGLPSARNTGLEEAQGDLIAYLDDDDWFYPQHVATLVQALSEGHRAAYTDADVVHPGAAPRLYMSNDYSRADLRRNNLFPVCCVMHERKLIDQVGGFDPALPSHEDWDLWIRMSAVTYFHHVAEVTCAVDRTRETMMDHPVLHPRGYWMVKAKYDPMQIGLVE